MRVIGVGERQSRIFSSAIARAGVSNWFLAFLLLFLFADDRRSLSCSGYCGGAIFRNDDRGRMTIIGRRTVTAEKSPWRLDHIEIVSQEDASIHKVSIKS